VYHRPGMGRTQPVVMSGDPCLLCILLKVGCMRVVMVIDAARLITDSRHMIIQYHVILKSSRVQRPPPLAGLHLTLNHLYHI